ncbi:hypothetical protein OSTOST_11262, partial [Ostertagia ostertagi]
MSSVERKVKETEDEPVPFEGNVVNSGLSIPKSVEYTDETLGTADSRKDTAESTTTPLNNINQAIPTSRETASEVIVQYQLNDKPYLRGRRLHKKCMTLTGNSDRSSSTRLSLSHDLQRQVSKHGHTHF